MWPSILTCHPSYLHLPSLQPLQSPPITSNLRCHLLSLQLTDDLAPWFTPGSQRNTEVLRKELTKFPPTVLYPVYMIPITSFSSLFKRRGSPSPVYGEHLCLFLALSSPSSWWLASTACFLPLVSLQPPCLLRLPFPILEFSPWNSSPILSTLLSLSSSSHQISWKSILCVWPSVPLLPFMSHCSRNCFHQWLPCGKSQRIPILFSPACSGVFDSAD